MARFLNHTSCSHCGSSDAKGLYDDGSSFCFSCKHVESGKPWLKHEKASTTAKARPDDLTTHFSSIAVDWLSKTGIDIGTLIKHGVRYSPSRNQIVFTWKDTDVWQARNMAPEAKSRYFTSGNHDSILLRFPCESGPTSRILLTEDALSAIKCLVAECDAMPLLGAHLPTQKMKALKRYYTQVDVFLDEDKFKDACKIADKLRVFGLESRVFLNKHDPKHIPYDELKEILV